MVIARLGKPARERQHQCHDVLGDRAGIDAAGAREPHAMLPERLTRELIGAGTDRLDEAQPLRARQEVVAPEPRDHQHVGLADPLLEGGAVAHLEALDAGRERQEALAQPIGNMRKTDRQLVLGRSMASPRNSLVMQMAQDSEPNAGLPPVRRHEHRAAHCTGNGSCSPFRRSKRGRVKASA